MPPQREKSKLNSSQLLKENSQLNKKPSKKLLPKNNLLLRVSSLLPKLVEKSKLQLLTAKVTPLLLIQLPSD
jgi:hypothetical protein